MPGGAAHLAHIYGTEEDRVHCPFYLKVGACRHGDRCSRQHIRPLHSTTICLPHMYDNPMSVIAAQQGMNPGMHVDYRKIDEEFDEFYTDVYEELAQYGEIDELVVVDNLCDHLVGNVMCSYFDEEDADVARRSLHTRWFAGRQLTCEFSPVHDFRAATCRQHDEGKCRFGGQCSYLHLRRLRRSLVEALRAEQPHAGERSRRGGDRDRDRDRRRRSRSPGRDHRYDRRGDGGYGRGHRDGGGYRGSGGGYGGAGGGYRERERSRERSSRHRSRSPARRRHRSRSRSRSPPSARNRSSGRGGGDAAGGGGGEASGGR